MHQKIPTCRISLERAQCECFTLDRDSSCLLLKARSSESIMHHSPQETLGWVGSLCKQMAHSSGIIAHTEILLIPYSLPAQANHSLIRASPSNVRCILNRVEEVASWFPYFIFHKISCMHGGLLRVSWQRTKERGRGQWMLGWLRKKLDKALSIFLSCCNFH